MLCPNSDVGKEFTESREGLQKTQLRYITGSPKELDGVHGGRPQKRNLHALREILQVENRLSREDLRGCMCESLAALARAGMD